MMLAKIMKTIIGYIPPAIVIIPFATAWIRQALYYKGCMDGVEFVITAFYVFIIGGILNIVFLISRLACRNMFVTGMTSRQIKIANASVYASVATILLQLVIIAYFTLMK